MKRSICALVMFMLCVSACLGQTESDIRKQIVGTWKLVSTELIMKDGTTRPDPRFGLHSKGFLMYHANGYMCADLVNPDRPKWVDPAHPTTDEMAAAGGGTFAYCGHYEIDVNHKQLVHLPEVATDPNYVGSRQIRPYTFQDGRLVLGDVEKEDPAVARWKIVWEKAR